jgi:DNA-binding XRE family transcriptional regulator
MGLTYGIIALDESAIRTIIREAEIGMADGSDAKALLVAAAQDYIATENAVLIAEQIKSLQDFADMMGTDVDTGSPDFLADVRADFATQGIGEAFDRFIAEYGVADKTDALCYALAKSIITAKPVLPMHRGKWLSKVGIVASHIAALGSGSTASTPPVVDFGATSNDVEDDGLADMLGLSEEAPAPLDEGGYADIAVVPVLTTEDALSAVAPSHSAVEGPPTSADPRGAMILFGQAASYEDADLAKRLGVSRSTVHNYLTGKTVKVKLSLAQARVMLSEIDLRLAKLAEAAKLLSAIRE